MKCTNLDGDKTVDYKFGKDLVGHRYSKIKISQEEIEDYPHSSDRLFYYMYRLTGCVPGAKVAVMSPMDDFYVIERDPHYATKQK